MGGSRTRTSCAARTPPWVRSPAPTSRRTAAPVSPPATTCWRSRWRGCRRRSTPARGVIGSVTRSARWTRPVHLPDELAGREAAVALGHQLADLLPVDAIVDHDTADVVAPARLEVARPGAGDGLELPGLGAEGEHDVRTL